MEHYKLEKPDLSGVNTGEIIQRFFSGETPREDIAEAIAKTANPQYLYWDKIKRKPLPEDISPEEFWVLVKFLRKYAPTRQNTPIHDTQGRVFWWWKLSRFDQFLHEVDMKYGGHLARSGSEVEEKDRFQFISRGIVEEAIASSQLEGANTTRRVAKEMIRQGRKPRTESEQMIFNNYEVMVMVEEDLRNAKLDLDTLFHLHETIVKNTEKGGDAGRFRKNNDDIVVADHTYNIVYHDPPSEQFIPAEVERCIAFANDELDEEEFTHPVIKATMLHFWIGYLHPFTDGNGRLARLLFYWYLLKNDYWGFAYLPISKVIKRAEDQYKMAYIYSEQDDNDLTYFIDYNIRKIQIAMQEFEEYKREKEKESKLINRVARRQYSLNDRQVRLLQFYYENRNERTSPMMHMKVNQISKKTAINDLRELERLGFLRSEKQGRNVYYWATEKIDKLFATNT